VDSIYIAFGAQDGSILVYNSETKQIDKVISKGYHSKAITCMKTFSMDSASRPRLVVGSADGTIALWNIDTCKGDTPTLRFQMVD
jgi:WD40 repeat protein